MHLKLASGLEYDVELEFTDYRTNGNTAILVMDADDGERVCVATTNLEGVLLPEDEVMIKDYGECSGIKDFLVSERIIDPKPANSYKSPCVTIYSYKLTEKGLELKTRPRKSE